MIPRQNDTGFLYPLLISPSYRWLRHIVFLLIGVVVSLNNASMTYVTSEGPVPYIVIPVIISVLLYTIAGYLNIYFLIPRFFLTRRFVEYLVWFSFLIMLVNSLLIWEEYIYIYKLGIQLENGSYFTIPNYIWFIFLSDFVILAIILSGVSITVILKHWLLEVQQLNRLEKQRVEMEIGQIKKQISPSFLFRMLRRIGAEAGKESFRASTALLYLSRLLRYQLYDGSRPEVLLSSEIQFLNTYLLLEQYEDPGFSFCVSVEGEVNRAFIAPLLFLPLIQQAVGEWKKNRCSAAMGILFIYKQNEVSFCAGGLDWSLFPDEQRAVLLKRIQHLYPQAHRIESNCLIIQV